MPKTATFYIDGAIHPANFDSSPFFKKLNQLARNQGLKTAVFLNKSTSQKVLNFFITSGLSFTTNEKDMTDSSLVLISNEKSLKTVKDKGFTNLFVVDEVGDIRHNLFNLLRNEFDVHYFTTNKAFETLILNECTQEDRIFFNGTVFLNRINCIWSSLLVTVDNRDFFRELSNVDLYKQYFLNSDYYILSEPNKPLRLIETINNTVKTLSNSDLNIEEQHSLDNSKHNNDNDSILEKLEEFTNINQLVLTELKQMSERFSNLEDKIEGNMLDTSNFLISDEFEEEDPLAAFRT